MVDYKNSIEPLDENKHTLLASESSNSTSVILSNDTCIFNFTTSEFVAPNPFPAPAAVHYPSHNRKEQLLHHFPSFVLPSRKTENKSNIANINFNFDGKNSFNDEGDMNNCVGNVPSRTEDTSLSSTQNEVRVNQATPTGNNLTKACVIAVPVEGLNGEIKQVLREVHEYPPEAIIKTVEKSSYLNGNGPIELPPKKRAPKTASIGSSKSSTTSHQKRSFKEVTSTNKNTSLDGVPSWFIDSYYRDRDTFSCISSDNSIAPSETSSNISTYSDLSGYENEYSAIKRIVSDLPYSQDLATKSISKKKDQNSLFESLLHEQDDKIRDITTAKEDLEIQLHRSSIQLQNSLREKESLKEEIELLRVKINDVTYEEYYELLKQKATLDGQLEAVNLECGKLNSDTILLEKNLEESNGLVKRYKIDQKHSIEVRSKMESEIKDLAVAKSSLESRLTCLDQELSLQKENFHNITFELKEQEKVLDEKSFNLEKCLEKEELWRIDMEKLNQELAEVTKNSKLDSQEKILAQTKLAELTMKLESVQSTVNWYQEQLTKSQATQSELQRTLSEAKNAAASATSDSEKLKAELCESNSKMEEDRVRAVKEKTALLSHLEELEADMKEREASMQQSEVNKRNSDFVKENKIKKLEDEHKKYQKLRLEMIDLTDQKESLLDDLLHKKSVIRKLENEDKDLRKKLAMLQETVGEKGVLISSLTHQLEKSQENLEKSFEVSKEKDSQISSLKVQNLKMEAAVKSAESSKALVDETVVKLKEDILRLSTNFYRMKHDLAAKNKQLEGIQTENEKYEENKMNYESEIIALKSQIEEENNDCLLKELKQTEAKLSFNMEENASETLKCKKIIKSLESEKDSLINSLKLQDSQIEELMTNIDIFKEKISLRESRLQILESKCEMIQRSYLDASVKCSSMQQNLQQAEEENTKLLKLKQDLCNQITELEKTIALEKKSKANLEEKYQKELECTTGKMDKVHVQTQTIKDEHSRIPRSNTELKRMTDTLHSKEKIVESLSIQVKEMKKEATLKSTSYEKKLKLKQVEIKKLQDALNKYERKELHKAGTNTTKIPPRPKNTVGSKDSHTKEFEALKEKHRLELTESLQKITMLEETNKSIYREYEGLQTRFNEQEERLQALLESQVHLEDELKTCQANLDQKTKECHEWRNKYERLIDSIPVKDPNSATIVPDSETGPHPEMFEARESDASGSCIEGATHCQKFDQTMLGLQNQFALASEALKSKDDQIIDLKSRINELQEELEAEYIKQLDSPKSCKILKPIPVFTTDVAVCTEDFDSSHIVQSMGVDASTMTLEKDNIYDEQLKEKDSTIEGLTQKLTFLDSSFKEKHRCYESNIRLLTKKLKEHMKGRRASEKQLEMIMQENERKMSRSTEQYKQLMDKHLALEQENQLSHLQLSSCDDKAHDLTSNIQKYKDDISDFQRQNLELQKRVSCLQELQKTNDDLETKSASLEEEIKSKSASFNNLVDQLQLKEKEIRALKDKILSLDSKNDILESSIRDETVKLEASEQSLKESREMLLCQTEKMESLKLEISNLVGSEKNLKDLIIQRDSAILTLESTNHHLCEKFSNIQHNLEVKEYELTNVTSKVDVLERQIKISEDQFETSSNEIHLLKNDREKVEEDFKNSISSFESQLRCAQSIENSLTEKLDQILKEKLFYQSKMTEFKLALNSALSHIQRLKSSSACIREMPLHCPMDVEDLKELIKKSSEPPSSNPPLHSLSDYLSSIRQEVSSLKKIAQSNSLQNEECQSSPSPEAHSPPLSLSDPEQTNERDLTVDTQESEEL